MRARLIFIVVAIVVVAAFATLNWPEFTRATPLNLGVTSASMPLGVLLLVLLAITLAVFLVASAIQESRYLLEHRRHSRALQAQRDLAERAESSRFTDLRQHLDTHLRESRAREAVAASELEKSLLQGQRELRTLIEQMNHQIANRLSDLEARLEPPPVVRSEGPTEPAEVPPRDRVAT